VTGGGGRWLADGTLRALVERMVPADEDPSGWQAGVGNFLERILRTDLAGSVDAVGRGLRCVDAEARHRGAGATFADLGTAEQDALLAELAAGVARADWGDQRPAEFVGLMARLCAQGFYGDPGNGGNRDAVSWRMVGYRELPEGVRWPDGEVEPGRTVPPARLREQYDAVIVGAGAGGCVAAAVLAEAGMRVLLVERGRWLSAGELPLDHLRSERLATGYPTPTAAPPTGHPRVLGLTTGAVPVDPTDPRWGANAMTVGGGTRVFGAQAWRFSPEDFRMAGTYGVPAGSSLADWPIGYDDLREWYDLVEWDLGVAGAAGGDRFAGPRDRGYPMPPLEPGLGARVLAGGAHRFGLTTGPVPLLVNSIPRAGRPACVRCGACVGFACQAGAKNGVHNTVLPRALATGRCDLIVEAQAERVTTDAAGRVDGVALVGDGAQSTWRRQVRAGYVVLAAGAIETARLLLNSPTRHEPTGLGNGQGQVGRNLQAHVYAGAIGIFDDVVQDSTGPGPGIATNDFRHRNPGIVGGGMIANDFVPTPLSVWDTLTRLRVIDRFGPGGKDGMRRLWSRLQLVFGPVQEVPNPSSRVRVDPRVRDRYGIPVARLSGDIHPEDRRTARFLADRAADWLTASGARTVLRLDAEDRPEGPSGGQHQAGTCRMGADPATSVTDSWGRLWGHQNVVVADGSVHVTNGGVNPVLTILALAYRNAGHLAGARPGGRTGSPGGPVLVEIGGGGRDSRGDGPRAGAVAAAAAHHLDRDRRQRHQDDDGDGRQQVLVDVRRADAVAELLRGQVAGEEDAVGPYHAADDVPEQEAPGRHPQDPGDRVEEGPHHRDEPRQQHGPGLPVPVEVLLGALHVDGLEQPGVRAGEQLAAVAGAQEVAELRSGDGADGAADQQRGQGEAGSDDVGGHRGGGDSGEEQQ
jgi:choline dehydrogenase-like flavoprotein